VRSILRLVFNFQRFNHSKQPLPLTIRPSRLFARFRAGR
jgi:hypothetical protein